MSTADALTLAGALLEIGGFALIAWQLVRVQRREFGPPEFVVRAQGWVRRQLARMRGDREVIRRQGKARASGAGQASASGMAWHDMREDRPDRVDAIIANLNALSGEVSRLREKHSATLARLRQDVDALCSELSEHAAGQEAQRQGELRASIKWEAGGIALFVAGVVCSMTGSLAN